MRAGMLKESGDKGKIRQMPSNASDDFFGGGGGIGGKGSSVFSLCYF